ncbi:MAG: gamma-glutamyl-gamma-aminobutyrate hydrolase family protein, partial [Armatimonadetes bacterium]|nr:gamma-glutamyl-gamma-aminobutyrate hydrolase family protein [Armatimonadota bacterium]
PGAYGEARRPECGQVDRLRDEVDRWALETAIERTLPVLGICRGIQALAAFLGGSLHQDIPGHQRTAARNVTTHEVVVEEGTLLSRIVGGGRLAVNSFHHQALRVVPPGYRISARATDGTVEGLEAADGAFRLGVQWHPEDLAAESALHQGLFDALVEAARYSSVTPDCRDLSP